MQLHPNHSLVLAIERDDQCEAISVRQERVAEEDPAFADRMLVAIEVDYQVRRVRTEISWVVADT